MQRKCNFGIIGSGWRAEFYMRIAQALPDLFQVSGIVTRNKEKKVQFEKTFGYRVYNSIDDLLLEHQPDFMVVSVSKTVAAGITAQLSQKGIAVLAETPPATNIKELNELYKLVKSGARIQIAEQYFLQPMNAAALSVMQSGRMGNINYALVSFSHGYHAISLIRKILGIGYENAIIQAHKFSFPLVEGFTRAGMPEKESIKDNEHVFAFFDFGNKLGLYDFENNQHRSWARSQRIMARGERGEINNADVKYLKDFETPIELTLKRMQAGESGNLEGYYFKGVLCGEQWIYQNPFIPISFSDEEIAIAMCLLKMKEYVEGGPEFYSLAEASQDQYLALMMEQALESGEKVTTQTQGWAHS